MAESLWSATADELLNRTASAEPTPGGGSIAAITGALGIGLMQMALAVTADASLEPHAAHLAELQQAVTPAADGDVADFSALMDAYRMPRGDDAERAARTRRIETASIAATERPLELVGVLAEAVEFARELESLVKPAIVSDVLAGRDVALGAARAAVRTADINLAQLERLSSPDAPRLRARRDELVTALEEAL